MLYLRCRCCTMPVRADRRWCLECGQATPERVRVAVAELRTHRLVPRALRSARGLAGKLS